MSARNSGGWAVSEHAVAVSREDEGRGGGSLLHRYTSRVSEEAARRGSGAPRGAGIAEGVGVAAQAQPASHGSVAALADLELTDDLGCFGYLRGVRDRAVMLELRKRDGSVTAFGYGWLERAEFDPSGCITLVFVGRTVRLRGKNLNGAPASPSGGANPGAGTVPVAGEGVRLFDAIVRQRVPWVAESSRDAGEGSSGNAGRAPVIDRIEL